MNYKLFHKNTEVATFEFDALTQKFGNVLEIKNENHLPVGISNIKEFSLSQALQFWWNSRIIPENRQTFKLSNLNTDLYGFNLSDQYWIKAENSQMTWEKGNFFQNNFNEEIGLYLAGINKNSEIQNMISSAPDFFSNGEKTKRWVLQGNKRILLKYGTPPFCEDVFNEVLASEICRRLNFSYVDYSLISQNSDNEVINYSACPCFIDENTEYVPAGFIQYACKKNASESEYTHLLNCCKILGMNDIENIENEFSKMIVLDYIMANTDRHFGNFGFIRNADTLEWLGVAPIFDTGSSMFYDISTSDLKKSFSLMENVKSKTFATTQKKQLVKFTNNIIKLDIDFSKLSDLTSYYENLLAANSKTDNERITVLSSLLSKRILNTQKIIFSKNSITENFINEIKNSKDTIFMNRIVKARNKISQTDINKKVVDNYLRFLDTKNSSDLELKIKAEIKKRSQNFDIDR